MLNFVGGFGLSSLASADAFLSARSGLAVVDVPAIVDYGLPFNGADAFVTGVAYQAPLLTTSIAPANGVPTIAEWTRSGNPGDTIALTGSHLGAGLHVFVYAQQPNGDAVLAEATVISAEDGDAVIALPSSLPAGGTYTLWASNSSGFGPGVLVNAPELWWAGSDEVAPGAVTSLYGRNLALPGGASPSVVLEMTDGAQAGTKIALTVVQSTSYRVDVRLPADLPDGHYQVFLNNNGGGATSWSQTEGVDLTVRAAVGHDWAGSDHVVLDVAAYGAVPNDGRDNAAALQKAMDAARALITGGGPIHEVTIQLQAGTYDVSSPIMLEDGVNLQGAGAGKTTIAPTAAFAKTPHTFLIWAGDATTAATATGSRVGDLTLDTLGGAGYTAVYGRNSQHMSVEDVSINAENGTPFDIHASTHFTIDGSTIIGPSSFIGSASQASIHDNAFYGTNQAGENITGFGASDLALYNNTAQNLDATPTAATWQTDTYQGRFYVDESHYGQPVNQYIGNNTTTGLGAYIEYADQGAATNTGEQILFEGAGQTTTFSLGNGLLKSSTGTTLVLSHTIATADGVGTGALLTVAAGTGAGETTEVTGYDTATATFQFADPLAVPLDATSTVILSRSPNRIAIVGNHLDGRAQDVASSTVTASTGVEIYPGGARVEIDGNTFSDLRQGVSLWSFPATKDDPTLGGDNALVGANFFDIKNNTVVNSNVGVSFHQDPGGAADLNQPAAIVDSHMTVGTTIRNNDLSGATDYSIGFETRQPTTVDIAAANVASGNKLSAAGTAGGLGFDGGSSNLLIVGAQTGATGSARLQLAESLEFSNVARYFGAAAGPAFQATFGSDGSLALNQTQAVAGTADGQAALIATAGSGDDIGFTSDSTDSRLQVLDGGAGDDILIGSTWNNDMLGGIGDDILVAGSSTLLMSGGAGADAFVLTPDVEAGSAAITDFRAAEGDKIVINAALPSGVDPVAGGYLKIVASATGSTLMFDQDGGGNGFVPLATVAGTIAADDVSVGLSALDPWTGSAGLAPPPASPTGSGSTTGTGTGSTTGDSSAGGGSKTGGSSSAGGTGTTGSGSSPAAPSDPIPPSPPTAPAPTPSTDVLTLLLSEDNYKGDAQFTVNVDGVQVGGTQTVTAHHSAGKTQTFTLTGSFGSGAHTVSLDFLNPQQNRTGSKSRAIYVKSIAIDGTATAENAVQRKAGAVDYTVSAPQSQSAAAPLSLAAARTLTVAPHGTLVLDRSAGNDSVAFTSGVSTLELTDAQSFRGTISHATGKDTIDLRSIDFAGVRTPTSSFASASGSGTLSVTNGTDSARLTFAGNFTASDFHLSADAFGGTAVTMT